MNVPKEKPSRIRLALVDDSEVVRAGLRALLSTDARIEIVGEAGTAAAGVELCGRIQPEIVLLDIRLPDGTGFDVCRAVLQKQPELRVLMLTSMVDDTLVDEAIRSGAHGYLLKEVNGRELVQAIVDVAAGKSILDPAVTARVMRLLKAGNSAGSPEQAALASLSPQEKRVLALIAEGRTNKEVGSELGLSEKTVKNYLSNIFSKLHVTRRAQAAALFAQGKNTR